MLLSPLIALINMKHPAHLKASSSLFGSRGRHHPYQKSMAARQSISTQSGAGGLASSNTVTLTVTRIVSCLAIFIINNLTKFHLGFHLGTLPAGMQLDSTPKQALPTCNRYLMEVSAFHMHAYGNGSGKPVILSCSTLVNQGITIRSHHCFPSHLS